MMELRNLQVPTGSLEEAGVATLTDGTTVELPRASFRRLLRETRKRAGLSQAALAGKVSHLGGKMHSTAVTRIERGDREVSLEDVLVLAAALDVSPLYLIFPRGGNELARLTATGTTYLPLHLREWMRGQWSLEGVGPYGVSPFFARERAAGEDVLWSEKYLVHRLCDTLAGLLATDILSSEGFLAASSTPWPEESPEERLDAIGRRLRTVVEEVESYVSRRRRELDRQGD